MTNVSDESKVRLTLANTLEGAERLPKSRESDPNAKEMNSVPSHPHHEPHHHQILKR